MTTIVSIERFFPLEYLQGTRNGKSESVSELFGKSIIQAVFNIDENLIRRGNPENNEPDFLIDETKGLEITFASRKISKKKTSISRLKMNNYHINDVENEVISSIIESTKQKANKQISGNYDYVSDISILIICNDPIIYWYDENLQEKYSFLQQRKIDLFNQLFSEYIQNEIFDNIYLLMMADHKKHILFDIREIITSGEDWYFNININEMYIDKLPHCTIKNVILDESNSTPIISYQFKNIFETHPNE